jgi:hypothetical protein
MYEEEGMKQMDRALHELCQPLTTLQCGLEIAGLTGTPEAFREAVEMGLRECARLAQVVGSMREIVCATRPTEAASAAGRRVRWVQRGAASLCDD